MPREQAVRATQPSDSLYSNIDCVLFREILVFHDVVCTSNEFISIIPPIAPTPKATDLTQDSSNIEGVGLYSFLRYFTWTHYGSRLNVDIFVHVR